jgi:hypothetical protein
VANPFFGNPAFAGTALGNNPTTTRAQLLRPYPQFVNVNMRQVSEGVNRYNAGVIEVNKRVTHGFGGRFSYTYSRLMDNQVGEQNFYTNPGIANTTGSGPMNNYNYVSSLPACGGSQSRIDRYNSMCFDPMVDYTYGILDTPHRVVIAPIVELPFGRGKPFGGKSNWSNLLVGGWIAAAVFTYQSGFPIGTSQSNSNSNLQGNGQRPNLTGAGFETPGDWPDRIASADHASAAWLNPAAFASAPAGTWGDAPRVITEVRTPIQTETDLSVSKNVGLPAGKQVQIKLEVINLFNRVQLRGNQMNTIQGNSAFGTIVSQGGFMRTTQVMFRYSW